MARAGATKLCLIRDGVILRRNMRREFISVEDPKAQVLREHLRRKYKTGCGTGREAEKLRACHMRRIFPRIVSCGLRRASFVPGRSLHEAMLHFTKIVRAVVPFGPIRG